MFVNLPSFQKNDFILSLMVYNYCKNDICLAIGHYVLNCQTKFFKALFGLFLSVILNGHSNFIALFSVVITELYRTLWI